MGVIRLNTDAVLGDLSTSRTVTITTASAQSILIGFGFHTLKVVNLGPINIAYGDSAISMGSGVLLFPQSTEQWSNVDDRFTVWFRADSADTVTATLQLHEFP